VRTKRTQQHDGELIEVLLHSVPQQISSLVIIKNKTPNAVRYDLLYFCLNPFQPELILAHRKNKFHVNCV